MAAFLQPVAGRISSPFGAPRSYGGHVGVDLAVPTGTPVKAAAPGKVTAAGWISDAAGLGVKLDHGGGVTTSYFHMSRPTASVGASVAQGDVIGLSGSTGSSTGPHVHWEVRINGAAVNPLTASYTPQIFGLPPVNFLPAPAPSWVPDVTGFFDSLPPTYAGLEIKTLLFGGGLVLILLALRR